ncbi:bifunctional helix-turn-helix transcriptional regulator/GNAT family N-acetyltransferase [Aliikangiella sp. G2MR2-5]|uniref:bifunctional helix-turn-helix transcriptional regulator/GNAT family N-acetyltransferase n=1 Tax=Aliikangiella sp. G2MR2-5 TaxID=2788943 RepID=UPI0018A8BFB1|nr:bifunctional helix-turn-helix transcriptional regulator/GNAT family N-acetyltransferase [Aliikangiella sp. G2MR2-5]
MKMELEDLGLLSLGSRLKRASELLFKQTDELYQSRGIDLSSRSFPLLQLLQANGPTSVTSLAEQLGQTHPAISQISKKLKQSGWLYFEVDELDERKKMLSLTPQGYELVDRLQPLWKSLQQVLNNVLRTTGFSLLDGIGVLERALKKRSLTDRVEEFEKKSQRELVEIIHYMPIYRQDFYRLNRHWLEKYFYVESIDEEVLSNPEKHIIEPGGFVLLARLNGRIIGTAALINNGQGRLELSKMSVDESYQGLGIGEKLAKAAIEQYKVTEFTQLYLESNRKLTPALNLYSKLGFVEEEPPFTQSHYARADIYMVFHEGQSDRVEQ